MTKTSISLTIHQKWLVLFSIWLVLLTGCFARFIGSPGALQAIRLRSLLKQKEFQLEDAKAQLQVFETEVSRLKTHRNIQEQEIRKVLGYAAPDELIFDFTPTLRRDR